jgi:hypothetical protein
MLYNRKPRSASSSTSGLTPLPDNLQPIIETPRDNFNEIPEVPVQEFLSGMIMRQESLKTVQVNIQ